MIDDVIREGRGVIREEFMEYALHYITCIWRWGWRWEGTIIRNARKKCEEELDTLEKQEGKEPWIHAEKRGLD